MSKIPDFGEWGNGPDDVYTAPEQMRRVYFAGTSGPLTFWGTARVPPTWTKRRVREVGLLRFAENVSVSFDVRMLRHLVDEPNANAADEAGR